MPAPAELYSVRRGMLQALPIVACYLSVSFAIGVFANQCHLSLLQTIFLSFFVYSGSGQSIALQLLALGQPVITIFATTLVINLRYFLLSSALVPRLAFRTRWLKYLFAFGITDETFALHATQFRTSVPPAPYLFAINVTAHAAWFLGSALGYVAASSLQDLRPFGLDFAVPGMFIALLVLQMTSLKMAMLALVSGGLAVLIFFTPLHNWAVVLSGVVCALVAAGMDTWKQK